MSGERSGRAFWAAFAGLAALGAAAIWRVESLPLVDLPQHEAVVAMLARWGDPACALPERYEIRAFTPYWLGYALAWLAAQAMPVDAAVRLVLTLVLVGLPLATRRLLRGRGGDAWWALAAFPAFFAFPTAWGFFSFVCAVPPALVALATSERYARQPAPARGVAVALFALLLFFAHALAMLFVLGIFAALVAIHGGARPRTALRLWPALPALVLLGAWSAGREDAAQQAKTFFLLGFDRIAELPRLAFGVTSRGWGWLALLALAAGAVLAGARWSRDRTRLVPLAIALGVVLLGPTMGVGTAYVAERFAIFLLPLALAALAPAAGAGPALALRLPLVAVAAALLVAGNLRWTGMDTEGAGLREVLAAAPSGERLLYFAYDRGTRHSGDPVFVQSGVRYLVEKCGEVGGAFVDQYVQMPVRARRPAPSLLPPHFDLSPQRFKWERHGGDDWDLFLVRTAGAPDPIAIGGGVDRLRLLAHAGRWWLYARAAGDG